MQIMSKPGKRLLVKPSMFDFCSISNAQKNNLGQDFSIGLKPVEEPTIIPTPLKKELKPSTQKHNPCLNSTNKVEKN